MRVAVCLLALGLGVACGPAAPAQHPVITSPPLIAQAAAPPPPPCGDAATGLERATRDLRAPDDTILRVMMIRCQEDHWTDDAVACFATMTPDDLATCVAKLAPAARTAMVDNLEHGELSPAGSLEVAQLWLASIKVGVAECDQFVAAVADLMACEAMPIDARIQLGRETADLWSLPDHGLPADAAHRMALVCDHALGSLHQQATAAGCPAPAVTAP
jgi:hypothetical protein